MIVELLNIKLKGQLQFLCNVLYTTSCAYDPSNSRPLCSLQSTARVIASLPLTSDHYCRPTVTTGHPPDGHNHKPGYPGTRVWRPSNP